ncbi:Arylsulfatase B [Hondaea fermentalgiana]|uniref:Arylsulfatase B n=1 Tax=Hondaea fermentalgiana TaxID=2315210 RepID=A0A2R5GLT2_9STRA|nr:Arylsulfatase B [Hondaea fermentalgiana]|eukprot:GBG31856.1 Arylsulfatase B [Hondaea fermentalgiana]
MLPRSREPPHCARLLRRDVSTSGLPTQTSERIRKALSNAEAAAVAGIAKTAIMVKVKVLAIALVAATILPEAQGLCKGKKCGFIAEANCQGYASLEEAEALCAESHGTLCSLSDLKRRKIVRKEAREFSCTDEDDVDVWPEYFWTSSTCKRRGVAGRKIFRHERKKVSCETDAEASLGIACCGAKGELQDSTEDAEEEGSDGEDDDSNEKEVSDDETQCAAKAQDVAACQAEPRCVFYFARSSKDNLPYGCHAAQTFCDFETEAQCASRCNNWRCEWSKNSCQQRQNRSYPALTFDADLDDAENTRCAVLGVGENTREAGEACETDSGCKWMCDRCRARPRANSTSTRKPHIILSLADDLGWNDIGYQNSAIDTPTLNGLAADGIKLTRHYQYRFCSPSRSMLLTGMFAWRYGQQTDMNMNPFTSLRCGMQPEMTMLPELLKTAGYATHMVGKWHLGHYQTRFIPTERGFDSFVGYFGGVQSMTVDGEEIFSSNRCSCPGEDKLRTCAWAKFTNCATARELFNATAGQEVTQVPREAYIDTIDYADLLFADEAARIIENHDLNAGPMFLFTSWDSPHNPHEAPERFMASSKIGNSTCALRTRRKLAGMVNALDTVNKVVLDALEARGMWDDTLFIFASDNGGNNEGKGTDYCPTRYVDQKIGSNYPLRGQKFTFWEGGVRTHAFIAGGANVLPQSVRGTSYDGLVSSTDWFKTILDAAGLSPMREQDGLDSKSHWAAFTSGGTNPRHDLPLQVWGDRERFVFYAQVDGSLLKFLRGYPGYLNGIEWKRLSKEARREDTWDFIHLPEELDLDAHPEAVALGAAPAFLCEDTPCIFNLTADPSEIVNLGDDAGLVSMMESLLEPYVETELAFQRSGLCSIDGKYLLFDTRAITQARQCGCFAPWLTRDPNADPDRSAGAFGGAADFPHRTEAPPSLRNPKSAQPQWGAARVEVESGMVATGATLAGGEKKVELAGDELARDELARRGGKPATQRNATQGDGEKSGAGEQERKRDREGDAGSGGTMPARTGPEEMLGQERGLKMPLRREARPSAGACACVAAVLAVFAVISTSMLVGSTEYATYSMGPFAVSNVRLATVSHTGTVLVASGMSTFGSVDDTACLDETISTNITGTTTSITSNNFQDWGYPYGFCDEPEGSAGIPMQARALQAFIIILALCAIVCTSLLCGTCAFKRRSRPFSLAAIFAWSGAVAGVLAIAQIASWKYSRDLRAGIAYMPVRIGSSMYGLQVETELSYGSGFVGLTSSTLVIIVAALYSMHARNEIRRQLADEEDALPPRVPGGSPADYNIDVGNYKQEFSADELAMGKNAKRGEVDHTTVVLSAV